MMSDGALSSPLMTKTQKRTGSTHFVSHDKPFS